MENGYCHDKNALRTTAYRSQGALWMVLAFWISFITVALGPMDAFAQGKGQGKQQDDEVAITIRGSMTFEEVARVNQVPVSYLMERLRLPPDTPLGESIRNLREQYNFKTEELRRFISEYRSGQVTTSAAVKGYREPETRAVSTTALSLILYGILCVIMVFLLAKNWVTQTIRLLILVVSISVFGIVFQSRVEPMRAVSKIFQSIAMDRYLPLQEWLLVFIAFVLMAVIGVKLICGWGCPVGALQEFLYHLPILKGVKKKRVPFGVSNSVRIALFFVFVILILGWIADFKGESIYRYFNPFKLFEWKFRKTALVTMGLIFGLSIIHYRTYCMWICPFGLLSWSIQNFGIFKVRVNRQTCNDCGKCVQICPSDAAKGIYEGKMIQADCFSCARCLTACPNGSIEYRWRNPVQQKDA